jgi:hypothetical protein
MAQASNVRADPSGAPSPAEPCASDKLLPLEALRAQLDALEAGSLACVERACSEVDALTERVAALAAQPAEALGAMEARLQEVLTAAALLDCKTSAVGRQLVDTQQVRETVLGRALDELSRFGVSAWRQGAWSRRIAPR